MDTETGKRLLTEDERQAILAEAETWIGTRYHHKGRVKHVGVDCGGLIYELMKPYCNILPPYPEYYAQDWCLHKDGNELYLDYMAPFVRQVPLPKLSSIAVFKYGRSFSHGALYTGRKTFIHAYGRTGDGHVMETQMSFFRMGNRFRPVKYFELLV